MKRLPALNGPPQARQTSSFDSDDAFVNCFSCRKLNCVENSSNGLFISNRVSYVYGHYVEHKIEQNIAPIRNCDSIFADLAGQSEKTPLSVKIDG